MKSSKAVLWLSSLMVLLVLMAATTGVFSQTPGAHIAYVTVRGEHATYQGSGLYTYDPASVAREGIIWDGIDLVLALPLVVMALILSWRGSLRGRLLLGGMLFYFFYQYMQYAVMMAFNPLFVVYIAIFALSGVAFFLNLQSLDVSRLPAQMPARFPRWLFIGFPLVMSAAITILWVAGRIFPYMQAGRFPDEIAGLTTLQTQALDLGLVVPLLISTAILLWQHSPWGYLLAAISLTFGFVMSVALPAWMVVPLIQGGQMNLIEALPFSLLSLIGLFVAGRFFWGVHEEKGRLPGKIASV